MPKNDKSPTLNSPRGFDADEFERAASELGRHLDLLSRCVTGGKKVLNDVQKQGTIASLATTDATKSLEKHCQQISELCVTLPPHVKTIAKLLGQWRSAERGSRRTRFEVASKELGWHIAGDWPEPVVNGCVFVVVDDQKDKATINGTSLPSTPTSEILISHVHDELEQLNKELAKPKDLVASIWKACQQLGVEVGEGVLVFDLLRELFWQRQSKKFHRDPSSSQFRPYSVAQFRADLTSYLAAGAPPFDREGKSYVLDIVGGSFADEGIFMYFPSTDRLATCGRLTFRVQ